MLYEQGYVNASVCLLLTIHSAHTHTTYQFPNVYKRGRKLPVSTNLSQTSMYSQNWPTSIQTDMNFPNWPTSIQNWYELPKLTHIDPKLIWTPQIDPHRSKTDMNFPNWPTSIQNWYELPKLTHIDPKLIWTSQIDPHRSKTDMNFPNWPTSIQNWSKQIQIKQRLIPNSLNPPLVMLKWYTYMYKVILK